MRLYGYFTHKNYFLIFLEYVNNRDLKHFMKKYKGMHNQNTFSETLTAHFILQTLKALGHLKLKNIVHRDIKPENLLLNSSFMVKLGDFTLARKIEDNEIVSTSRSGTIPYLPPECIIKKTEIKSSQLEKLDLFSLGVVMYMLLYNKHPFNYKNNISCNDYTLSIEKCEVDYNCDDVKITDSCKDLLSMLLEKDINKRCNFDQVTNHKWILGMKERVGKIFEVFEFDGEKLISELNKDNPDNSYFDTFKTFEVECEETKDKNLINKTSSNIIKTKSELSKTMMNKKRNRPKKEKKNDTSHNVV